MTHVLLFCIAEQAKPASFIREILNVKHEELKRIDPEGPGSHYLVESKAVPVDQDGFKVKLDEGETFETDFIDATVQDCQKWALENWYQVNFIVQGVIAIADARTAQDKTIIVSHHASEKKSTVEFPGFGVLPPKVNTWYDYRVDYAYYPSVETSLLYGPWEAVYPTYFGRKDDFTDERGVFDVAEAERYILENNWDD